MTLWIDVIQINKLEFYLKRCGTFKNSISIIQTCKIYSVSHKCNGQYARLEYGRSLIRFTTWSIKLVFTVYLMFICYLGINVLKDIQIRRHFMSTIWYSEWIPCMVLIGCYIILLFFSLVVYMSFKGIALLKLHMSKTGYFAMSWLGYFQLCFNEMLTIGELK